MLYKHETSSIKPVLSISEKCIIDKLGGFKICRPRGTNNWVEQQCGVIRSYCCYEFDKNLIEECRGLYEVKTLTQQLKE